MKSLTRIMCAIVFIAMTVAVLSTSVGGVAADTSDAGDSGNVAWMLTCSALVFIMVPGVAMFYGGMLRKQSISSILSQTLIAIGVMSLSWIIVGYSLAFSSDATLIGNLDNVFLNGVLEFSDSDAMSSMGFAMFQMMFAIITAAIILGACAERVRYVTMLWFLVFWSVLVYAPMAHWVWGGGLFDHYLTVLDFAGGTVVHICAGITGVAIALFVGRRSDRARTAPAHNIPMAFLGCFFLWFGWIGFNGGSGLAADGQAIRAVVVSMVAAAAGMMAWMAVQYIRVGRVGVLGMIAGAIAGLVAITPGAGYVDCGPALLIGAVGGVLCYFAVSFFKTKTKLDDALDVFGVHGIGGIWGAIATGIFAKASYSGGVDGLLYGGVDLFVGQIVAVLGTLAYCFIVSYALIWLISKFMRVRVTDEEELVGQDLIEHGEYGYHI